MNVTTGRTLLIGLSLFYGSSAHAQLTVNNGSFEQGLNGWTFPALATGVTYSLVSSSIAGTQAVAVSTRYNLADLPRQNVSAALRSGTNGTIYSTRFYVRATTDVSARCRLQFADSNGVHNLILAERMILNTGVWQEVRGSRSVSWLGNPTNALLYFEIGELILGQHPDVSLDHIRISPDTDRDGLADSEEPAGGVYTNDTDGDGLTDLWEYEHSYSSLTNESAADDDDDGFTNREEFWAATDPHDALRFPGRPANPNMSREARAVLEYLALLPARTNQHVIAGQHVSYPESEYTNFVQRLFTDTGKWPGIMSVQYDDITNPLQITNTHPYLVDYWTNGGLVQIKWQPRNPWTMKGQSDTNHLDVDLSALIDPASGPPGKLQTNTFAHANYTNWLREVADGLDNLKSNGVVVLWRPFSEMNGGWFWHGHEYRGAWVAMWRHMYDYFTFERNLNNLIWVYESDSSVHTLVPFDYYYPGDDVVDVLGHNFYHDTWKLPFDANALIRTYGKVYGFPQAGSDNIRDGSWTNTIMLNAIDQDFPRASFYICWNSFQNGNGWQVRCIVENEKAQELMDDPRTVTRESIDWSSQLRPFYLQPQQGLPSGVEIDWRGGFLQSSPDIVTWSDVAHPAWPHAADTQKSLFFRIRE